VRPSCTISGIAAAIERDRWPLHGGGLDHRERKPFHARATEDGIAGRDRRPRIRQMPKKAHAASDPRACGQAFPAFSRSVPSPTISSRTSAVRVTASIATSDLFDGIETADHENVKGPSVRPAQEE
jgi:hypothetical protein